MSKKKALCVLILLVVTMLACTCNLTPRPGPAPTLPPSQGGQGGSRGKADEESLPFRDDFSDEGSGWEVGEYVGGSVGYKDGQYAVTSVSNASTMWGVANRSFDDVVIEVDTTQISAGPESNNDYGIVCREQGDGDGYYLLISGDGYHSILKAVDGEFTELAEWTRSDAIYTGDRINHIEATCDGHRLALSVNGQTVVTAVDDTFSAGDVALTATTYENTLTEIHFDNLVVREP